MLRRIALSLSLLASMIVIVPLLTSTAHNLRSQWPVAPHRFHHHSRAWWRHHRALLRRRQALLARRRALMAAARNGAPWALAKAADNHASTAGAVEFREGLYRDGAVTMPLPNGWSTASVTNGISDFRIAVRNGMPEAHATLAVVALSGMNGNQTPREQRNMLGRVSFSDLRHSVIDRMFSAGGWVINDRQRDIGGRRVFEVIAQTPASNNGKPEGKPEQVWNFYFTEANGRIYSLTTHTNVGFTERLAADAEKVISTLGPLEAVNRNPVK